MDPEVIIKKCEKCGYLIETFPECVGLLPVEIDTGSNHTKIICDCRSREKTLKNEILEIKKKNEELSAKNAKVMEIKHKLDELIENVYTYKLNGSKQSQEKMFLVLKSIIQSQETLNIE